MSLKITLVQIVELNIEMMNLFKMKDTSVILLWLLFIVAFSHFCIFISLVYLLLLIPLDVVMICVVDFEFDYKISKTIKKILGKK
jgi:hypothetical protein